MNRAGIEAAEDASYYGGPGKPVLNGLTVGLRRKAAERKNYHGGRDLDGPDRYEQVDY